MVEEIRFAIIVTKVTLDAMLAHISYKNELELEHRSPSDRN